MERPEDSPADEIKNREWVPHSERKSRKRMLALLGVGGVVLVALVWARLAAPENGSLEVVRVERGTIERRLLLEGRARPAQTYSLTFPVPASDENVGPDIAEILVKAGDRVSSGQILARLEGDRVESALVRSPTDGVVVEVRGAAGAPPPVGAVVVVRTAELVGDFELTESNLAELAEGMEATLTVPVLSWSGPTTVGRLPQDPKASSPLGTSLGSAQGGPSQGGSEQGLNYSLEMALPSIEGLRPGMTLNLDVLVAKKEGVLVLPQECIRYDGEGAYVEVLRRGRREAVRVKTGLSGEDSVEILEGLSEGDEVVKPSSAST